MLLEEARKDAATKRHVTPGAPPDGSTPLTGLSSSAADSCSITDTVTSKHTNDTSEVYIYIYIIDIITINIKTCVLIIIHTY